MISIKIYEKIFDFYYFLYIFNTIKNVDFFSYLMGYL